MNILVVATAPQPTEAEVRALRDRVFGKPTTDHNWDACKDRWLTTENVAWLKSQKPHKNP